MPYFSFQLPVAGTITIQTTPDDTAVCRVLFANDPVPSDIFRQTPLLRHASEELTQYLTGRRQEFTVPLCPREGSPFAQSIWNTIRTIPFGKTLTYGDLAIAAGYERKFARAVGIACNRNPLPLFFPCHRVVGKNGQLTGYRGGLSLKNILLQMESDPSCKNFSQNL